MGGAEAGMARGAAGVETVADADAGAGAGACGGVRGAADCCGCGCGCDNGDGGAADDSTAGSLDASARCVCSSPLPLSSVSCDCGCSFICCCCCCSSSSACTLSSPSCSSLMAAAAMGDWVPSDPTFVSFFCSFAFFFFLVPLFLCPVRSYRSADAADGTRGAVRTGRGARGGGDEPRRVLVAQHQQRTTNADEQSRRCAGLETSDPRRSCGCTSPTAAGHHSTSDTANLRS